VRDNKIYTEDGRAAKMQHRTRRSEDRKTVEQKKGDNKTTKEKKVDDPKTGKQM